MQIFHEVTKARVNKEEYDQYYNIIVVFQELFISMFQMIYHITSYPSGGGEKWILKLYMNKTCLGKSNDKETCNPSIHEHPKNCILVISCDNWISKQPHNWYHLAIFSFSHGTPHHLLPLLEHLWYWLPCEKYILNGWQFN